MVPKVVSVKTRQLVPGRSRVRLPCISPGKPIICMFVRLGCPWGPLGLPLGSLGVPWVSPRGRLGSLGVLLGGPLAPLWGPLGSPSSPLGVPIRSLPSFLPFVHSLRFFPSFLSFGPFLESFRSFPSVFRPFPSVLSFGPFLGLLLNFSWIPIGFFSRMAICSVNKSVP